MHRSFALFIVSLSAGSLLAAFMTLWHTLGLEERISPAAATAAGLLVRIMIGFTLAACSAGLVWGVIENRKMKAGKTRLALIGNSLIALAFVLLPIYLHTKRDEPVLYTPPKNANYAYEEVRIGLPGGDTLAGSLTYPRQSRGPMPAVVLITGSSPHDRDNSSPDAPLSAYRPFRQIADRLSSNGITVLRMDDRGVGQSVGGDLLDMTTADRAGDIEECIRYLRRRPDIDGSRIGLIGLSEGVSISHMIASRDAEIKALVFLSGIGSPGKNVLEFQVQQGVLSEAELHRFRQTDKNTRFLYKFDPLPTVRMIRQPVLILHGDQDRYVPPSDARALERELKRGGNSRVTVRVLEGYDHTLLRVDSKGRIRSARIPDEVLTLISDWIVKEL